MKEDLSETWTNFIEDDFDTYPNHSGNWDDTSRKVVVYYSYGLLKYKAYGMGYTDWDGDKHYWNIDGVKYPFEVIAWRYFNDYDKTRSS